MLDLHPLSPGFGAEAFGVDLANSLTDAAFADIERAFFRSLYRLLIKKDTGPRLPTLLMALGQDRVRKLLTPPPDVAHRADNAA